MTVIITAAVQPFAYHPAAIVDPVDDGQDAVGDIERGEAGPRAVAEAVEHQIRILEGTHDHAVIVYPEGFGVPGARDIEGAELTGLQIVAEAVDSYIRRQVFELTH